MRATGQTGSRQYGSGPHDIFDGLELTIPAGQRLGLIGHAGAGKTTLVTRLMRLYDVQQQGTVRAG